MEEWAAPRFPDSRFGAISCCTLPVQVLVVDFLRSPVAECRMETRPIIAKLDVPRNVLPRFPDCRIHGTVHPLDFHRGIERLCERIIETRSGTADRLADPQAVQDGGELGGRVIAAAITVEYRAVRQVHITGGHLNRRGDQRRPVIVIDRPADHLPGRAVDHGRQESPPLPGRDIRVMRSCA
jgi:hypothetical protein